MSSIEIVYLSVRFSTNVTYFGFIHKIQLTLFGVGIFRDFLLFWNLNLGSLIGKIEDFIDIGL